MGTAFVLSHLAILGLLIAALLKYTMKRAARLQTKSSKYLNQYIFICYRPYFKLRNWLSWTVLVRLLLEFYLEIILSSTVVLMTMKWTEEINDRLNCVYGVIYFVITMSFPIVMSLYYFKRKAKLFEPKFRYQYGGGYEGIKTPTSLDREIHWRKRAYVSSIAMPLIFIGRRIIFAFSVIFFDVEGGATLLPILISFWTVWISLEFLFHAKPYEKNKNTVLEIFNEITLLLLICLLLGFTQWTSVIDTEGLGWFFVGIVFTNILFHFTVMVQETFKVSCNCFVKTVKEV